ncbi:hypothetical protein FNV43_RR04075 [Rhamnella rubrinervis]|uniref:MORF/ORRM1/DAG-like MORF domain-containing protein n=1 Tax=Rhamnella rubrinervis TaxID=2594499 RepID=A0A8K0MPQ1_9ROSA|nr:hypothetical protein FNV43_RR04075 [Rhamnella rubrinervis]
MATNLVHRSRSLPRTLAWAYFLTRNISTSASLSAAPSRSSFSLVNRLRPLVGAISAAGRVASARCFATDATSSSLTDPKPDRSNKPRRKRTLLEGTDFKHWLVLMDRPEGEPTRDEIIDIYIKTLASVVGSEEEARMKIYSVSTRYYYGFGALVSEELRGKIKECPKVRFVIPDSYMDIENKDYGGEPFINGQAVPYDPKYHAEWLRNYTTINLTLAFKTEELILFNNFENVDHKRWRHTSQSRAAEIGDLINKSVLIGSHVATNRAEQLEKKWFEVDLKLVEKNELEALRLDFAKISAKRDELQARAA